jgi:spore coat polysaccharide biosynthesis protein SpsF
VKTVAIVEARMRSSRLPGKVLRPILDRPMLQLLVERLRLARRLDQIVVATTADPSDDPVEALASALGVGLFRGSEEDVLGRVREAAHRSSAEVIVEVTGDCPLVDPALVDQLVGIYGTGAYDYVSNVLERTYPRGMDVQVFATAALDAADLATDDPVHREHVSLYIYEHPETFRLHNVRSGLPASQADLRLTVDTAEDLALVTAIFETLHPARPGFSLADILGLLDRRPELAALNRGVAQKPVR